MVPVGRAAEQRQGRVNGHDGLARAGAKVCNAKGWKLVGLEPILDVKGLLATPALADLFHGLAGDLTTRERVHRHRRDHANDCKALLREQSELLAADWHHWQKCINVVHNVLRHDALTVGRLPHVPRFAQHRLVLRVGGSHDVGHWNLASHLAQWDVQQVHRRRVIGKSAGSRYLRRRPGGWQANIVF